MGDALHAKNHTSLQRPVGRMEVVDATIRAAAHLFAERSPSQVTVREIAAQAGVSHALVHRYLGSKENIFRHALAFSRDAMEDAHPHCHSEQSVCPLDSNTVQGRYIRTVVRAALDGIAFTREELRPPHPTPGHGLALMHNRVLDDSTQTPGFDARVVFSAVNAMTIGIAVAEEFCLTQSGLEDADREWVCAEVDRLARHVLGLARAADPLESDPEPAAP